MKAFGLLGGLFETGKKYASGLFPQGSVAEVRGLSFKPRIIHVGEQHGGNYYQYIRNEDYGGNTWFLFSHSMGSKQSGFIQYDDGFHFPRHAQYQQYWYAFE